MKYGSLILSSLLLITGCKEISNSITNWEHPQHDSYLTESNLKKDIETIKSENSDEILRNAELGLAYYYTKDNIQSNRYLNKAINAYEAKERTRNLYQYYLRNKYVGEDYDKVLLRTYKALNYLMLGNTEKALISLHRAKEVQTRTEDGLEAFKQNGSASLQNAYYLSRYERLFNSVTPSHTAKRNPFSYYITALAYEENGEYGLALRNINLAKRFLPYLDILNQKAEQYRLKKSLKTVELFFDVGKSPTKKQIKIKMSLKNGVERSRYLPYYKLFNSKVEKIIIVNSKGREVARASLMADIKAIKVNEFKEKFPTIVSILSGEVADSTIPHLLQNVSPSLRILYNIGSAFSKPRRVSTWTLLPEKILVASFIPKQGEQYSIKIISESRLVDSKKIDLSRRDNRKNIYQHFTIKESKIIQ